MLIYTLLAVLIGFCVVECKGKLSYKLLIVMMFLLMAYMTTNADMPAYKWMYNRINTINDLNVTDPAFALLMLLGKTLKLDYYAFVKVIAILGLFLITYVFYKYSTAPAFVLALYFIFAFSAETIQLRAFLAEAILYLLLIRIIQSPHFDKTHYAVALILAVLLHSTSIFFILIIFAVVLEDRKKLLAIVAASCLLIPYLNSLLRLLPIPILNNKLQYYLVNQREGLSLGAIVYIALYLGITLYLVHLKKHTIAETEWSNIVNKLIKIHYIGLISCVLILLYSSNFYRITRTIIVVDFIFLINYWIETRFINKQNIFIFAGGVSVFFLFYEFATRAWYSIITNNVVLSWML